MGNGEWGVGVKSVFFLSFPGSARECIVRGSASFVLNWKIGSREKVHIFWLLPLLS
ncbi:MAG: hypothetical protein DSM106950_40165 [Stigonema ocellatum SAG 48.90 = DSM 106950]|nr:hypothetical protein [Stigonema ocellatum SAG 48.90 = DSM 106950]